MLCIAQGKEEHTHGLNNEHAFKLNEMVTHALLEIPFTDYKQDRCYLGS